MYQSKSGGRRIGRKSVGRTRELYISQEEGGGGKIKNLSSSWVLLTERKIILYLSLLSTLERGDSFFFSRIYNSPFTPLPAAAVASFTFFFLSLLMGKPFFCFFFPPHQTNPRWGVQIPRSGPAVWLMIKQGTYFSPPPPTTSHRSLGYIHQMNCCGRDSNMREGSFFFSQQRNRNRFVPFCSSQWNAMLFCTLDKSL